MNFFNEAFPLIVVMLAFIAAAGSVIAGSVMSVLVFRARYADDDPPMARLFGAWLAFNVGCLAAMVILWTAHGMLN